ncbi:recombinase family protein [Aliivibrio fischeri]|nr:hypothetical protein BEI47_20175 [Aliivibrio fischeri]
MANLSSQKQPGQFKSLFLIFSPPYTLGQMIYTLLGYLSMKIARLYIRVSSSQQDLERQNQIYTDAITAGYYVAGVYKEKASGVRADRPELLRLIGAQTP